ncbi:MAG: 16S rRNA (cytidine(1402)-2'-O)-methyltransferase [Candidatus Aminicenantes bacterium]|nr:16S rRNA (cytidine(1402)-2'-O)-methyltransferase [Candidatus Aminicenantes bacterium]
MNEEPRGRKPRGKLFIVATPIGNLEDLTLRALRVLSEVDIIACEDTRQTKKLLNRYNLKKKLISYFQPQERQKIPFIMSLLRDGKDVALVSDAGTPGLSDPGYRLIREAIREETQLIPIPGVSAVTAALTASGLPTDRFLFLGFPPAKKEKARKLLQSLKNEASTLVFYLPLRKILFFLETVQEAMGNREVVIAREMTKIHEEFIRGPIEELLKKLSEKSLKGEATVLIKGSK